MPRVTFLPKGAAVDVPQGTLILDAARSAGCDIEAPCGGSGTCGGCAVGLVEGAVMDGGTAVHAGESVLACKTSVGALDIVIHLPDYLTLETEPSVADDSRHELRRFMGDAPLTPLCSREFLTVAAPRPEDGLSDMDRLARAMCCDEGKEPVDISLPVMQTVAAVLRAEGGAVTASLFHGRRGRRLMELKPGKDSSCRYGIAVDLGTTTVALELIDLATGDIIESAAGYNGQVPCGADVIGRINYASTPARLGELRGRAVATVNRLVDAVCADAGTARESIACGMLSGNTVMTHLFLGLDPEYLRLEPYTPTVHSLPDLAAAELGIPLHPGARFLFSSAVGSYVGGDIMAGLLCTDIPDAADGISLFIDVGTNGEIALGNRDFIMACACSAGPAFEGGGLTCGMRATRGAIDRITIDPVSGVSSIGVIGGGKPEGICGSAAIELLAELFRHGWMDPQGRFSRDKKSPLLRFEGRRGMYDIAPPAVTISEIDIESLLRAKAAVYSAADLLLQKAGAGFGDIQRFYIAGGFGKFLDIEAAVTIGLLPDLPRERFVYLGNASLRGSALMLLSARHRELHDELTRRVTYVNLSNEADYMDRYTAALFVPHTDFARFPSIIKGA